MVALLFRAEAKARRNNKSEFMTYYRAPCALNVRRPNRGRHIDEINNYCQGHEI